MSCSRLGAWPVRRRARSGGRVLAGAAAAAVVATAPVGAQEQPTLPTFPPDVAITGARIVTVSGPTIDEGTIVVRDGIIEAVGGDVAVPSDAWVVDGSGLTVYPGLIDAFTTLGHPARRGGSDGQGQGDEEPHSWGPEDRPGTFTWRSAAAALDAGDDRIESWREAGFASALSTYGEGLFPGQAALINLAGDRGRAMVLEPSVAQRINLRGSGYDGYPGSLMGVFAYIKQLYYDARHYDRVWSAYEEDPRGMPRPEYDRTLEPLRSGGPVLFPAEGRKEILRAIATSEEIGAPAIIYGARRAYEAVDVLRTAGVPVLVDVNWPEPPRNGDPDAEPSLSELRMWEHSPTTPARLAEAGVPFALYAGGLDDPDDLRDRVRAAIDAGLPADAAVRALTLSPAQIFGVADRLGSIEVGKIANLVVANGELFDPETRVQSVFIDGRPHESFQPAERMADDEDDGDDDEDEDDRAAAGPRVPMADLTGPYRDDAVTLIRGATVLTVTDGTIEGGDVLIRDGRIAQVGRGIDAPSGARVVDATGMYVTPGIIDAHSHIAADAINEGSVNVSAMVGIKDVLDPEDRSIYRALAGGVTTINLLHGSANPIGGRNAVLKLRWGADASDLIVEGAPEGIKFALGENTKRDRDPDRYPTTRMGVQDVVRQAFLDARAYMREWEEYERERASDPGAIPPRRDLRDQTMAEILRGERLVHAHSYRADEILQLLRVAEEFGVQIATFQHVLEGYKVADEMAAHGAGASTFSDWWAYKVEAYEAIPYNAALMTDRGVVVSINSDSDEEMRHLNQEAAKAMKWGGLSETEALKLVTLNPAIQLRIDDRTGSIEAGKDADLVVWEGHPLSMMGVAQQTYVDGKLYFDIELDRERREALEREKNMLMEKHMPPGEGGRGVVTDDADSRTDGGRTQHEEVER